MNRLFVILAVLPLTLSIFASGSISVARPRGEPNTETRKAYCNGKLAACVTNANESCENKYSDAKRFNACFNGAVSICDENFGGGSICNTEPMLKGGTLKKSPVTPKAKK